MQPLEISNALIENVITQSSSFTLEQAEPMNPQRLYYLEMEHIWQRVNQLPAGQHKVVLSQIWEYGKSASSPDPTELPALAAHNFIQAQAVEECTIWRPFSPCLKDFWHIGISVSNAQGFSLQPPHAFYANLEAKLYTANQ